MPHPASPAEPGAAPPIDGKSVPATIVRRALVRRIDRGELELPLLPQVAGQVLSMSRDEGSDASAMADLIRQDQALAGHVMRVANSAAYMPRVPIVSLQQAIARTGMPVITEIAVATSIRGSLFEVRGQQDRLAGLWRHALATGTESIEYCDRYLEAPHHPDPAMATHCVARLAGSRRRPRCSRSATDCTT